MSAPPTPRSSAVTGAPDFEEATTIAPSRSLMSSSDVVSASTAMISEATEISNPVALVWPFSVAAWPVVMPLRKRSLSSRTRLHETAAGSMSSRTNLDLSSSESSSASENLLSSIPSFFSLRSMTGAKGLFPVLLSTGQSRPKSAESDCVPWSLFEGGKKEEGGGEEEKERRGEFFSV